MNKVFNFKVISIDLFGTVVDVRQSLKPIWRTFLSSNYSDKVVELYWERANEILREKLLNISESKTNFKNVRQISEESLADFFSEIHVDFDAKLGAEMWMRGHGLQNIYPDARFFLDAVKSKYPLCLSSECDLEMITNLSELYDFDNVFSSEKLRCYKHNPQFWSHVITKYAFPPDNILHIGDASSDIVGPAKQGILTCWINRHGRKWESSIKPDFEVTSLSDIIEIIGLK